MRSAVIALVAVAVVAPSLVSAVPVYTGSGAVSLFQREVNQTSTSGQVHETHHGQHHHHHGHKHSKEHKESKTEHAPSKSEQDVKEHHARDDEPQPTHSADHEHHGHGGHHHSHNSTARVHDGKGHHTREEYPEPTRTSQEASQEGHRGAHSHHHHHPSHKIHAAQQQHKVARELEELLARPEEGSGALSFDHASQGVNLISDAANAASQVKTAWDDWRHKGNSQNSRRELEELLARADEGSGAISLSHVGQGINLVDDAANVASQVKAAWDSWRNKGRRELDDLYDLTVRETETTSGERPHHQHHLQGGKHRKGGHIHHGQTGHQARYYVPSHGDLEAFQRFGQSKYDRREPLAEDEFLDSVARRAFLDESD